MAAARAKAREWWKELLCGGLLMVIAFAGQKDDALFAGFVAVIGAIFWSMGHSHRVRPLHQKVERMTASVGELVDEVRADRDTGEPAPPVLYLATRNGDRA